MNCKEQYYELIGEITAYPDTAIVFAKPFNFMKKHITAADFIPDEEKKIVIPMKKKSGALKETPSVSVSGESYEDVISWQIENVSAETYTRLDALKSGNHHLIINTFGDNSMLVRSDPYAYQFEYKEQEGKLVCELTIQNVCGAQRVL